MSVTYDVFRGSPEGNIVADKVTQTLKHNEVFIETIASGLCGTDEHFRKASQVLGHEGVGFVRAVGSSVTSLKIGDRAGFGFTHSICANCDNCVTGSPSSSMTLVFVFYSDAGLEDWDQFCRNVKQYGMNDFDNGSLSYGAVWDANCVFPIPDGLDSVHAAPLMCAGATVWTTLTRFNMRAADRVGIMGVGGLGHIAIKLAAALGYYVIVLSTSEAKRQEAMEFGASEYHVFRSGGGLPEGFEPIKHLLLCASGDVDYSSLLALMDTPSTIYPLTATFELSKIPTLELCFKGVRIQGSLVSSRNSIRTLLDFASKKRIAPTVMTFPLTIDGIEEAMKTLREGKMRYRGVLVRE